MGHAGDLHREGMMAQMQRVHLVFPGTQSSVRQALKNCMQSLAHLEMDPEYKASVELVLAEILNNVVEHAYHERDGGVIELDMTRQGDVLEVKVLDDGLPMPGGIAPQGLRPDLEELGAQNLPEGGFGWFLIRELTHDLAYRRDGNRNHLSFRMTFGKNPRPS